MSTLPPHFLHQQCCSLCQSINVAKEKAQNLLTRFYFKWDISTHWRTRFIENLACQSTEPVSILIHSPAFSFTLRLFVPAASSFYWRTAGVSTPIQMSLCPWMSPWSKCSAESLPFPGPANDLTGTKGWQMSVTCLFILVLSLCLLCAVLWWSLQMPTGT